MNASGNTDAYSILAHVTDAIRRTRIAKGLKQSEMAESCGCSRVAYSYFERGKAGSSLILIGALRKLGFSEAFVQAVGEGPAEMDAARRRVSRAVKKKTKTKRRIVSGKHA